MQCPVCYCKGFSEREMMGTKGVFEDAVISNLLLFLET